MRQKLIVGAGLSLLVLSGLVHGLWTDRWTVSAAVETAAARLDQVALTLGDWDGTVGEMSERERALSGAANYLQRRYKNSRTGTEVSVLLLCGHPGPISVHTPDICYEAAGFRRQAAQEHYEVRAFARSGPAANFFTANFRKDETLVPEHLRIFWSWNATGVWTAPENPRLTFARQPALYKLYVIRHLARADEPLAEDPSLKFMALLLPELQKCLFPES